MRSLRRPTLHWLLWLVIALLPLRGWALAQMAPSTLPGTMVTAMAAAEAADTLHASHAASTLDIADEGASAAGCHSAGADGPSPHPNCSLCVMCHAGLAVAPVAIDLALPAPGAAAPEAEAGTPPNDGPRRSLFRPPRHHLD